MWNDPATGGAEHYWPEVDVRLGLLAILYAPTFAKVGS